MSVADSVRSRVRARPRVVTAVLSVLGYALVVGTFAGLIPYPDIGRSGVVALSRAIAVVNAGALVSILAGYRFIRNGDVRRHRAAMLTAFSLILVFLIMYLVKVGGGFEKEIEVAGLVWVAYVAMMAVHILLSAVSVPVVIHAVVLGLTHTPAELRDSAHPRVGRIAVAAWSLSLFLGLVTFVMLTYYGWHPRGALPLLLAVPTTARDSLPV